MRSGMYAMMIAGALAVAVATAAGDIQNGDFNSGDDESWELVAAAASPGSATAEIVDMQNDDDPELHLQATEKYVYESEAWQAQYGAIASAGQSAVLSGGLYVPSGTTSIELTVESIAISSEVPNAEAGLQLIVDFTADESGAAVNEILTSLGTHTILLSADLDEDEPVTVSLYAAPWLDPAGVEPGDLPVTVSVDAVVDNVQFVPEPASLALLALGGLSLIRRRR